jgi:hypothetical protein
MTAILSENSPMPITVTCTCGQRLRAKDEDAGRRTKCPKCGGALVIPVPDSSTIEDIVGSRDYQLPPEPEPTLPEVVEQQPPAVQETPPERRDSEPPPPPPPIGTS